MIGVPSFFNKLQRDVTIEAAKKTRFEDIKLIQKSLAAAITYGYYLKELDK